MQTNEKFAKEFLFTDKDFTYLSQLAGTHAGINLNSSKRELVYGRLARRLRALGLRTFKEYCNLLNDENSGEFTHFINAITTNVTSFFRENHHFEFLANELLVQVIKKQSGLPKPRLRIWSAGCSSGQEPYSIAIVLKECIKDIKRWDAKILATDLDSNILDKARQGNYSVEYIQNLSMERRKKWFNFSDDANKETVKIHDDIKTLVTFRQLNLTSSWPMKGPFDAIFCRNVTIYFDRPTREKLIDNFANLLTRDGCLFVGHSESLFGLTKRFYSLGNTIHRKIL